MTERNWESFVDYMYSMSATMPEGRPEIAPVRASLSALVEAKVLPKLEDHEYASLFPMGFSPAESDLKLASGVGLARGWINDSEYEAALRADKTASPFSFLQTRSGKTFGENVAPKIAEFWLDRGLDRFVKISNNDLYDLGWYPQEFKREVRIELKASTEKNPRFQQVRRPGMISGQGVVLDYDVLVCLGLKNKGIEWWIIPAAEIDNLIERKVITVQHGGKKVEASQGTPYWLTVSSKVRTAIQDYHCTSESLRARLLATFPQ